MKLTRVEIFGFKSFARQTVFRIGDGITGIVGPNGCGKSNLVDAIQWALGETRPTKLRSSGMSDVVYRGDAASVDHAEVAITFDNADGRLPNPAPEITVARRMEKDSGESGYYINGQVAKLKEVRDLFLDTGLGVGGYSFMAQGQIDAILRASPAERRVLIEEAAGTSRYRVRRKEAVRRLERTEQDIQRATDLLSELERQVRSLKAQAGRARTYVEKRDRLRAVLAVLFVRRRRELQSALAEIAAQSQAATAREQAARAELATGDVALSTREDEQGAIAASISDLRTALAERKARADHLAARAVELTERQAECGRESDESGARRAEVAEQLELLVGQERAAEAQVAEFSEREREQREAKLLAQRRMQELARQAHEFERQLQELERDELDLVEAEQRSRSALGDVESHARALGQSRHKLEERSSERSRSIADAAASARTLRQTAGVLASDRAALEAELSADDDVLGRLYGERQGLLDRLRHRETKVEGERSRLLVVEEAINRHEGVSEVVRRLLERAANGDPELAGVEGIVADVVTAPAETARALEAALGALSEALVVPDRATADRVLMVLRREGLERIRILSRAEIPAPGTPGGAAAEWNDLLRACTFENKDGRLLGALLERFDLLPSDVTMEQSSPTGGRALVSADGEVMLSPWESISRGRGEFLGLITRRNERERLQKSVRHGEEECVTLRSDTERTQQEIALREHDREARARRRAEAATLENDAQREFQTAQNRLSMLREELALDAREMVHLDRTRYALLAERRDLAAKRAVLEGKRLDARARRAKVAEELQSGAGERQQAEEIAVQVDLEVAKLAERLKAAHAARDAARARLRERTEELKRAERRLVELGEESARLAESLAAAASERARLVAEVETHHQQLAALQAELEAHRAASASLRHRVHELRGEVESAAREVQALALRAQEQRLHNEMLEGRVREELLLAPDDLAAQVEAVEAGTATSITLPPPPSLDPPAAAVPAAVGSVVPEATLSAAPAPVAPPPVPSVVALDAALFTASLEALTGESERLRGTLARLGPVNVAAIDELQAVEGRATFLQQQKHDLAEAKQRLREMIDEIDKECETRFTTTYEAVREHFKRLFRRLFGGGRADLTLVETDDPAEMGIDIVAAPPGKDPRSIAMLSGGERTLTAAALLFGLFSTRPSPFCVLDEVDAALDEANVERYAMMVRDFLGSTQFLIVTHNKRTMAAADTLYGVTMEGNGISTPIAMRFEKEKDKEKAKEHAAGS